MEPQEQQKNEVISRAKEIDTGAVPLPMSNVILGLPYKPDPTTVDKTGVMSRPWSFADLVSQKRIVADLHIDNTTNGKVWEFHNTWMNVLNTIFKTTGSTAGEEHLRNLFGLKSWTLNFTFQFRSNFQQVGQLIIFYTNMPRLLKNYHSATDVTEDYYSSYMVQTQLPHRKIPMGEDQDVDVSLKWISPHAAAFGSDMYADGQTVYDYTSYLYDMGTLRLHVPFPMEVATGVDSAMTVRVWAWLSDLTTGAYKPYDSVL
ncbi:putative capsid protein [Solenopsis invicta virus 2]|uniref:Putative capsid protein n=1 Tax=Solenopsis invicta virus 2 TaxID=439491 RepID=A0A220QTG9_9VIRU|nr:putative capsid protein [Solenopsis invicta virus 2]ASK12213.1 putative capsid protein [Solenopsis invicta virus 2]